MAKAESETVDTGSTAPGRGKLPEDAVQWVRRDTLIAVLVSSLLGVSILHWVLVRRFDVQSTGRADRAAMITVRSAAAIASAHGAAGPALGPAMSAWAKEHAAVRGWRVANIEERTLEASSFPSDLATGDLPRRLQRDEKPLYDLGQELRANIDTNVSENSKREPEISLEQKNGRVLIAAPVEKDGTVAGIVQIDAAPEVIRVEAPAYWYALAFGFAPGVVVLALGPLFAAASRRRALIAIAAALVIGAIFAYRQFAVASLTGGARAAEARVAERVAREAEIVARVAPGAEAGAPAWDSDVHRVPLKIDIARAVEGERRIVATASYGIVVLSLAVLFFIALGFGQRTWRGFVRHRQAYAYVAPALFGMLLLVFFPFIYSIVLSFTSQNIYSVNKPLSELWVGFQNYSEILGDFNPLKSRGEGGSPNFQNFYWTLFFTLVWTVINVTIGVTVGLLLALILNTKGLRFKGAYRVLLILPWAMPNYITALIWRGMFHQQFGVINQAIQLMGGQPVSWFEKPVTSAAAAIATNGWLSFPFMMVVSLGALQSIPSDLYEAARVDGASRWQQFRSITLPSLKPALIPAVILSFVWTFNMFNIIYLVTGGEPAGSTEILITQAYKIAFEQYRYGYAAAYSTVIFAILLIYGIFQNRMTRATESIA